MRMPWNRTGTDNDSHPERAETERRKLAVLLLEFVREKDDRAAAKRLDVLRRQFYAVQVHRE